MSFREKLPRLVAQYDELEAKISTGTLPPQDFMKFNKERVELQPVADAVRELMSCEKEFADIEEMQNDPSTDKELLEMMEEDYFRLKAYIPELERKIQILLLPKDKADEKNAILEIRAGTGGEEAALFAGEIFTMYQGYAKLRGWKFEIMSISEADHGGMRDATATISGDNVFARLKFESGVHRVQRVPKTESGGRIHTSTATVAVLAEAEEVDIQINESDLRIDVFRSQGPGGQSVNTTDSAVRITHLPTGLVVSQQDEKSQHKNKAKALKVLRSRLYEREREMLDSARSADRKSQVGSGERSEKIRTYNFPQSRVTDHRIGVTLHKMESILAGEIEEFVESLIANDQAEKLAAAVE